MYNQRHIRLFTISFLVVFFTFISFIIFLLTSSMRTYAAETDVTVLPDTNHISWTATDYNSNSQQYFEYGGVIYCAEKDDEIFAIHYETGMYGVGMFSASENKCYTMDWVDHTGIPISGKYIVKNKDGGVLSEFYWPDVPNQQYNTFLSRLYSVSNFGSLDFQTNTAIFDSLESAQAYYINGDESGVIKKPEENTIDLNSLYLTNVKLERTMGGWYSITWDGTSLDNALLDVPNDDTLIVPSMIEYDLNTLESKAVPYFADYVDLRFSVNRLNIDFLDYLDFALLDESKLTLTELYLTPCYTKDGKLFMGRTTIVDLQNGKITQKYTDDDGEFHEDDVTPDEDGSSGDSFSFSDITDYTNNFFNFLKSLINSMGSIPTLFSKVFSFMPSIYVNSIGVIFLLILFLRILGR